MIGTENPPAMGFVCPDCKSILDFSIEAKNYVCRACGRKFPCEEGIAFLLPSVLEGTKKNEDAAWRSLLREGVGSPPWLALVHKRQHIYYLIDRVFPHFSFGGRVLEIGAGTCWASSLIKLYYPSATVYSLDLSPFALRKGQRIASLLGAIPNFFCVGDGEALPFEDEFFDVVFGCAVLHHYIHLGRGLAEVYRVLRHQGRYIGVKEFSKCAFFRWMRTEGSLRAERLDIKENSYSLAKWKSSFERAGFSHVDIILDRDWRYVPVGLGSVNPSWLPLYYRLITSLPESLAKFLPTSICIYATK